MHMGYPGEQVMLDLEVETPDIPGKQFIVRREVHGGIHLMNCPVVLHNTFCIGHRVCCAFQGMSELEYDGQHHAGNKMHQQKAGKHLHERNAKQPDRYSEKCGEVDDLHGHDL